jgi:hypothetical protein
MLAAQPPGGTCNLAAHRVNDAQGGRMRRREARSSVLVASCAAFGIGLCTAAPPARPNGAIPEHFPASAFAVSPPVRDLPPASPREVETKSSQPSERGIGRHLEDPGRAAAGESSGDAALVSGRSRVVARTALPGPAVSFEGLDNDDNQTALGFLVSPSDANIDVGPDHVVQGTNLLYRVFDKTGTPLTNPFTHSDLFSSLGGACASADGFPVVLYDPLADRWLLSQFAIPSFSSPPYFICIAVSQTGDPSGSYFLYAFQVGGPAGNQLPEGPKLAVWPDGYYLTVDQFTNGVAFSNPGVAAFDRRRMLAGDPAAGQIYFDLSALAPVQSLQGMLASDLDGLEAPPLGAPNVVAVFGATEFGDPADELRLFDFHADFDDPVSSTFSERNESPLAVASFDPISRPGRADVDQPPPADVARRVEANTDELHHRLQYRNRGGFESWVVNHTVDASGDATAAVFRAGVRYYELRRTTGPANPISVFEQATFAPADTEHRWSGSAAVDHQGNLAIGYSVSSTTVFPSIRYAGKLAGEAPAVLAETAMIGGSGVQLSLTNRWSSYSNMAVDPADDCTFWYSTQYYTAASQATSQVGWLTHVASFGYPQCSPAPASTIEGTISDCASGDPLAAAAIETEEGHFASSAANGTYSFMVAPGDHDVTASFPGYASKGAGVTASAGGTSILDLCLDAVSIHESAGATLVVEGCAPANGALDPGETATVALCVQNVGALDTTDLVGTLQATGGVVTPGAPQSYGVVLAGGPPGCRNFILTVSGACGGTVTATLELEDGPESLGEVVYQFTLGTPTFALTESFDGVVAPALPAGWVATTFADVGGNSNPWATTTSDPHTAPNSVFTNDPDNVSDETLDMPSLAITSAQARLQFRHSRQLETGFDGGVLEISIGGGPFTDILAVGGSFVQGGYSHTINLGFGNPIGGRQAWSGDSGGYVTTIVDLPASAMGQSVTLRFRRATDNGVAGTGWHVDTLELTDGSECCAGGGGACSLTCSGPIMTGNQPGLCSATVNYSAPTPTGICGAITCAPPSGSIFPAGSTMVTCSNETQQGSCSFQIEVDDVEPPAPLICPADVFEATAFASAVIDYDDPSATDNCTAPVSCVPPSGSTFPLGTTAVNCTATDPGGSMATCEFDVTVQEVVPAIPAVSKKGLAALALLLAIAAMAIARRMTA